MLGALTMFTDSINGDSSPSSTSAVSGRSVRICSTGRCMNAGLRDAFNVAWKVKLALDGTAPADSLGTYETERKGPITEMIEYAVALGEIVMPLGGLDEAA